MIYQVHITETLERTIEVEANTKEEAEELIREKHRNEEIVLSADDFIGTDFTAFEEE